MEKAQLDQVTTQVRLAEDVEAPVEQGQKLGEVVVLVDGEERQVLPLVADQGVERLTIPGIFLRFMRALLMEG